MRLFGRATLAAALVVTTGALASPVRAGVKTGLDVLKETRFEPLHGKRVGVVTNHTGVDAAGRHIVDLLLKTPGVRLAAVFSPEHGFTGRVEHGKSVTDSALQNIPLYSLYGKTKRPTPEMLKDLDALVFDMQDIGTRFYTYITTMGQTMEEAAKAGIEFYVLDRPNPVTGMIVEGEILDSSIRHFTAYYSIPTRHGLTAGELAGWHNEQAKLNAKLTVVKMEGWTRGWWDETALRFLAPSPNIRSPHAALLYAGIGAFESTNVSVGRGTKTPFEVFGAPWADGRKMADLLNAANLPGVHFKAVVFTPKGDNLYAGQKCGGVRVEILDRDRARLVDIFVHSICLLRDLYPDQLKPRWDEMPRVVGSRRFEEMLNAGAAPSEILSYIHESAHAFEESRKSYLLYP